VLWALTRNSLDSEFHSFGPATENRMRKAIRGTVVTVHGDNTTRLSPKPFQRQSHRVLTMLQVIGLSSDTTARQELLIYTFSVHFEIDVVGLYF